MPEFNDAVTEALLAARHAKAAGLTQTLIAEAVGASQSQVSRVLSGLIKRRSKLHRAVCSYVFSSHLTPDDLGQLPPVLVDALKEVWDGSPGQAEALALVIRSLAALSAEPATRPRRAR